MCNVPQKAPVAKIPKDGVGPRGKPECYYVSRVLNSTFRYVKFIKRLRAQEDEQRKGAENAERTLKDQQISDFFLSSDRRSLINNVSRRVDLCMQPYYHDLDQKRKKLIQLYKAEEEADIRRFVVQAQAGTEALWQEKKERLQYLLEKRKKEQEEKYEDTPLTKCVHVLPCIYKLRAKEAAEIQMYQMKEKEARKMAQKEFDQMWHEVAMKESEALKARMEKDAIERYRRDLDCKQYTDKQLEENAKRRETEREMLIEETKRYRSIWAEENRKEEEKERQRAEGRRQEARDRESILMERQAQLQKEKEEEEIVNRTWDSLAAKGMADQKAMVALARKKERDTDICNVKMSELKNEISKLADSHDEMIHAEAAHAQRKMDERRCGYQRWAQKTNREVRQAMVDQIKDRKDARQLLKQKMAEQDEYHRQLFQQLQQLGNLKELEKAQNRKKYQDQLVAQIEYNKLLKERARQDELDQIKKAKMAAEEYEKEIQKIMCRPFFSDEVHPFMKQMAGGLKMREKCPCSKPDHCQQ